MEYNRENKLIQSPLIGHIVVEEDALLVPVSVPHFRFCIKICDGGINGGDRVGRDANIRFSTC